MWISINGSTINLNFVQEISFSEFNTINFYFTDGGVLTTCFDSKEEVKNCQDMLNTILEVIEIYP